MMHILHGNEPVAELTDSPSLASWLMANPDTHDYEPKTFRFKWRNGWRLVKWPNR